MRREGSWVCGVHALAHKPEHAKLVRTILISDMLSISSWLELSFWHADACRSSDILAKVSILQGWKKKQKHNFMSLPVSPMRLRLMDPVLAHADSSQGLGSRGKSFRAIADAEWLSSQNRHGHAT